MKLLKKKTKCCICRCQMDRGMPFRWENTRALSLSRHGLGFQAEVVRPAHLTEADCKKAEAEKNRSIDRYSQEELARVLQHAGY